MSIASELTALNGYILGAYDEVDNKGGTVPQNKNMANLATAIASISGGGGGGGASVATGTYSPATTSNASFTITHNLGVVPKLIVFWDATYRNSGVQQYQLVAAIGMTRAFATELGTDITVHRITATTTSNESFVDYIVTGGTAASPNDITTRSSYAYSRRLELHGANATTFGVLSGRTPKVIAGETYAWVAIG